MAEAHGQLTGRPAACLGTRAVGAANLAIGIHTARQDSTPDVRARRPGRARAPRPRGVPGDRPGRRRSAAWRNGPPSPRDAGGRRPGDGRGHPPGARRAARARSSCRWPRTCSTSRRPTDARVDGGRPGPARPADGDIRAVIELLASAERPVILAGGGILRARTSTDLLRFAELLQVPVIAAWRRADVISNDHPLYLGMAGLGAPPSVRERLASRRRDARHRLPPERADLVRRHDPGGDDALGPRRHRAARGRPACARPTCTVAADARAFLRAANERLLGKAVLDAELVRAPPGATTSTDRAAWEAASDRRRRRRRLDGPGRPSRAGRSRRCAASCPTTRSSPPTPATSPAGPVAGFRFRKPGTFLGPTSGAMGYGDPGRDRGGARPSRPAGRRARRATAAWR